MIIIWFSEIKWAFLKTRKQQILSRFTEQDTIYFIEPISKNITNKYTLQDHKPVYSITIPQLRSVLSPFINKILNYSMVRKIITFIADLGFRKFRFFHGIKPDIIITSNVYWANTLYLMKKKNPSLRIIYDCNDDPLAFPHTPDFKRDYFSKTVSIVDAISLPHNSYKKIIPAEHQNKIKIISNGVDFDMFQKSGEIPEVISSIKKPIIMYVGAIYGRFDFNLIEQTAQRLFDHQFVIIGPISNDVHQAFNNLLKYENIKHIPPIPYHEIINFVSSADVCIIPLIKNRLTSSMLPNKLFEYAAAGKTCVMTNFNESLNEFKEFVHISDSTEDFIQKIEEGIKNPFDPKSLKQFASEYDWNNISGKYRKYLESFLN